MDDYDITKVNYSCWFYKGVVLYPLSYSTFTYSDMKISNKELLTGGETQMHAEVTITNAGEMKGDEVVQLYVKYMKSSVVQPTKRLRDFQRISLCLSETKTVSYTLSNEDFSFGKAKSKSWIVEAGDFEIQIGSSSADIKLKDVIVALN